MGRPRQILLLLGFLAIAPGGATMSTAREIASVPLPTTGRSPLVEVTVDGKGPFRMMVDAGNETVVPESWISELGLEETEDGNLSLPNVSIGGVELGHLSATTWAPHPISPGARTPDGFLALSAMSDYLVTLDYARERLVLETGALPEVDGKEILEYELTEDSAVKVPVRIAGVGVYARMDAGAIGDFTLPIEYAERLPLVSEPARVGRSMTGDGRQVDIVGARLDGLASIGAHEIERPGVEFSEAFSSAMVGFDAVAHFAITFDQKNRRVRLRANADHARFMHEKAALVRPLDPEDGTLVEFFNANSEKVHLMAILSPT